MMNRGDAPERKITAASSEAALSDEAAPADEPEPEVTSTTVGDARAALDEILLSESDAGVAAHRVSSRASRSSRPRATATKKTTTTTVKKKTTTTTTKPAAKKSTTTTAKKSAGAPANSQTGIASWYEAAPAGTCAHRTLAKGTRVNVTNLANGRRTSCVVADRGPYVDGFIIDLSKQNFTELAPLDDGVVKVTITW